MLTLRLAAPVAGALLLLACSGDSDPAESAASGGASDTVSSTSGVGGAGGTSSTSASGGSGGSVTYADNFFEQAHATGKNGATLPWANPPAEILDVIIHDGHVFACGAAGGLVELDATTMRITGNTSVPGGNRCEHLFASDSVLVATSRGGSETAPVGVIALYDIATDPEVPAYLGSMTTGTSSPEGGVFLDDTRIAVAMRDAGVSIFQITPQNGFLQSSLFPGFINALDVALAGDKLYIADDAGVGVVDLATPSPTFLGISPTNASLKRLSLGPDGVLYAAAATDGVLAFDLSDPTSPSLISSFDTPGTSLDVAAVDGYVFVSDWNDVRVLDVSDPKTMKLVAVETLPAGIPGTFSRVIGIDALGLRCYIGEWTMIYDYELVPGQSAPDLALGAPILTFPDTPAGGEAAVSLIVQNEGDAPLVISNIVGDSVFVPITTTLTLAPGEKDYVEIRFRPTVDGEASAALVFTTNDPDESTVNVPCQGNVAGLGVGDALPAYTWVDLQTGQTIDTQGLQGKVILLSYFATF